MANYDSVENGDAIIDTAIKAFGRIDILLNNAGILRDVSFKNMKDQDWDLINRVHTYGAYKVRIAAPGLFRDASWWIDTYISYSVHELHGPTSGNKSMAV